MITIKKLESNLIDQIAAGEVIDRPASVLKELLENSLDAKSDKIEIHIQKGGHSLIQVADNGVGMNKDDLKMAFSRHATSKIFNEKDLNNINSLGFRGEALPSIASVSQIRVRSSINGDEVNEININGGKLISYNPTSGIKGSVFKVKNLFYNTPARRKFLKKPQTEQSYINSVIRRFMISHPNVSYNIYSNNKCMYKESSQNLFDRIITIYGNIYENSLLDVNYTDNNYSINGYVGNLSILKKRSGEQYLFINGRYIKNRLLNSAVFSSYESLVKRGEYPFFVLFINMPTDYFDVNVHPGKLEVRFKDEWNIYMILKKAVSESLKNILKVIPLYNKSYLDSSYMKENTSNLNFSDTSQSKNLIQSKNHEFYQNSLNNQKTKFNFNNIRNKDFSSLISESAISINKNDLKVINNNIWQIHNKYLITEIINGLIIIDQHVAHERILFEEAKKALEGNGFSSQTVLFPQTLSFLHDEYEILVELTHYLEKIGFKFREFGENTIIIEGMPPNVKWGNEDRIIREIIEQYSVEKKLNPSFIDNIAAIYACKSAIKAGEPLKSDEILSLVDHLFATEHPYYCPHGRPIIVNLTINELDQRFERT